MRHCLPPNPFRLPRNRRGLLCGMLLLFVLCRAAADTPNWEPSDIRVIPEAAAFGGDAWQLDGKPAVFSQTLDVPKDGSYGVRLRIKSPQGGSVVAKLDQFPEETMAVQGSAIYQDRFGRTVPLKAGKHQLSLRLNGVTRLDLADLAPAPRAPRIPLPPEKALENPRPGEYVFRFQVKVPGEYQLVSHTLSPSLDQFLYAEFQLDGKRKWRRVVFPGWRRKEAWVTLFRMELAAGEHTLSVKMPDNTTLRYLTVNPSEEPPVVPDAALGYQPALKPPAHTHPRLLVRQEHLSQIKANLTAPENAPVWQAIQLDLAQPLTYTPPAGDIEEYRLPLLRRVENRAFGYLITGDRRYAREAIEVLKEYLPRVDFDNFIDITRLMGHTIFVASEVYDWCYDAMTDAERTLFRQEMMRIAQDMEIGYPPFKQMCINSHGNEAQLSRDQLAMAIAIYDENPEPYRLAAYRIFEEMVPAHNYEYRSGRHTQGSAYGPWRFRWDLHAALTFERMTGKRIFSGDMEKVPYFWINLMLPTYELFDDADVFFEHGKPFMFSETFFNMYVYTGDPLLKQEFIRQRGLAGANSDPVFFLLFNRPEIKAVKGYAQLPLVHRFDDPLSSIIARSSWQLGSDSPAAVVEMKGATYCRNDHQHMDAGAFQIFCRAPLAVDLGIAYWGDYIYNYSYRTIAHNGFLVRDPAEKFVNPLTGEQLQNDGGQKFYWKMPWTLQEVLANPQIHSRGKTLGVRIGPDAARPLVAYLKSDLTEAYAEGKLKSYERAFAYFNRNRPGNPALLFICDTVCAAKGEFPKYFLLNSPVKPTIEANCITIVNRLNPTTPAGRLVATNLSPGPGRIEINSVGNGDALEVFGRRFPVPPNSRNFQLSRGYRTTVRPTDQTPEATVLTAMQIGDADAPLIPMHRIDAGKFIGVKADDICVLFPRDGKALDSPAEVTLTAPETLFFVTGLVPGAWRIECAGKALYQTEVKPGDGTLLAFLKPGSYRIVQGSAPAAAALPDYHDRLAPATPELRPGAWFQGQSLQTAPCEINGKLYLEPDEIARHAGATWNAADGELRSGRNVYRFRPDGRLLDLDGQAEFELAYPVVKQNGRWLVEAGTLAALLDLGIRPVSDVAIQFEKQPTVDGVIAINGSLPASGDWRTPFVDGVAAAEHWGSSGPNQKLEFALRQPRDLAALSIGWYRGDLRRFRFEIQTSPDGQKFTTVFDGASSGKSNEAETYRFPVPQRGVRVIRLRLLGNTENEWNSIHQIRL